MLELPRTFPGYTGKIVLLKQTTLLSLLFTACVYELDLIKCKLLTDDYSLTAGYTPHTPGSTVVAVPFLSAF